MSLHARLQKLEAFFRHTPRQLLPGLDDSCFFCEGNQDWRTCPDRTLCVVLVGDAFTAGCQLLSWHAAHPSLSWDDAPPDIRDASLVQPLREFLV